MNKMLNEISFRNYFSYRVYKVLMCNLQAWYVVHSIIDLAARFCSSIFIQVYTEDLS